MTPRPALTEGLAALRIGAVTDEEKELLELTEHVVATHDGSSDDRDSHGYWGRCTACQERWPCAMWEDVERLVLEWLIRKTNATVAHADRIWDDLQTKRIAEAMPHPRHESPEQEPA